MTIAEQLRALNLGEVSDDEASLDAASRDASLFEVRPRVIVAPRNVGDLAKIIRFVSDHPDEKLSLTPRSGATDMTGGPLTESIVVDVAKHFNQIKEVGDGFAITQPGVFYRDFEKATLEKGWLMPSYPASREICTVGGMVANNSGGEKSLTYGKTIDYVERLKVVLSDGNEIECGPLDRASLDKKLALATFEGDVYRGVFKLLNENRDLVASSRPNVSKNSAGYQIWDVWDRERGVFDLSKLFVGSQGTLGLVTELTFNLVRPRPASALVVMFLHDIGRLAEIITTVLAHKPEAFESYDDKTLKLAILYMPEFITSIGVRNVVSLVWQFLPEMRMALFGGIPKMVLMAEFTGATQAAADTAARLAKRDLESFRLKVRLTKNEHEIKKYWTIRRESFNLLRHHIRNKQTAPFIDDIIVLPKHLPKFLPELQALLKPYKLTYSMVGHVGNGNFHIIPLMDLADPRTKQIIPEISEKVYDLVLRYKGSITAEHNDGLLRSPFLKKMYGDRIYAIFEEIKRIFDPRGIFNPGKKVNSSWDYAMSHLKTEHRSYHW